MHNKLKIHFKTEVLRFGFFCFLVSLHRLVSKSLAFDDTSRFVFTTHNKSYILKENSEIDFFRAEYFYGNFKVTY